MSTSKLEFKDSAYLDTALPASERVYVEGQIHPSVRVPLREVSVKDGSLTTTQSSKMANDARRIQAVLGCAGVPVPASSHSLGLRG